MTNPHLITEARNFGARLIAEYDLDPVYVMLNMSNVPEEQLARWLVVYWLAYRVDVATQLCDAAPFWPTVTEFMLRTASPRGAERRHYRGGQAASSLKWLAAAYPTPETMVHGLSVPQDWAGVVGLVRSWKGFGPWIAFKAADMASVVLNLPFKAPEEQVCSSFYGGVTEAAQMLTGEVGEKAIWSAANKLASLRDLQAPHWGPGNSKRSAGLTEIETCLCKNSSRLHGHYYLGKDIEECLRYLGNVQRFPLGAKLRESLRSVAPRKGLMGAFK